MTNLAHAAAGRHPAVRGLAFWLDPNPRLPEREQGIAAYCARVAEQVLLTIGEDSPELTAGLRKLLEAKDCFVRASLDAPNMAAHEHPSDGEMRDAVLTEAGLATGGPRYPGDPELQAIYEALPAQDCGYLERKPGERRTILHCRLLDEHSGEHEPRPLGAE